VMTREGTSRRRDRLSVFWDFITSSLANLDGTGVEYFRSVKATPLGLLDLKL
jgi:hypothetical protein